MVEFGMAVLIVLCCYGLVKLAVKIRNKDGY